MEIYARFHEGMWKLSYDNMMELIEYLFKLFYRFGIYSKLKNHASIKNYSPDLFYYRGKVPHCINYETRWQDFVPSKI